jgi:hypothetical protein
MSGMGIVKATLATIPAIFVMVYAWVEYASDPYWWIASAIATVFLVVIWIVFAGSMSRAE